MLWRQIEDMGLRGRPGEVPGPDEIADYIWRTRYRHAGADGEPEISQTWQRPEA